MQPHTLVETLVLLEYAKIGQSHLTAVLLAPALLGVSSSSPHIAYVHVKTLGQQCGPSGPEEPGPGGKCT